MAERLRNNVVEGYSDKLAVWSNPEGEEGSEDFGPVGHHFLSWVDRLGVDTLGRNGQYNHCLVLDDAALRSLERQPAEVSELKPRPARTSVRGGLLLLGSNTWVWLLDRQTMRDRGAGAVKLPTRDRGVYPP